MWGKRQTFATDSDLTALVLQQMTRIASILFDKVSDHQRSMFGVGNRVFLQSLFPVNFDLD